jgi:hypothetical protein
VRDDELRRTEREAAGDAVALVREALAARRVGDKARARARLEQALALDPKDALAHALLLVTRLDLGERIHGEVGRARAQGVDLAREVGADILDPLARAALDPRHGPWDREAIAQVLAQGPAGALAVLRAFESFVTDAPSEDWVVHAAELSREFAEHRPTIAKQPRFEALARAALAALDATAPRARRAGALLSGALSLEETRPRLEKLALEGETVLDRAAGATGLAFLGGDTVHAFLEAALLKATTKAERAAFLRALEEIGD